MASGAIIALWRRYVRGSLGPHTYRALVFTIALISPSAFAQSVWDMPNTTSFWDNITMAPPIATNGVNAFCNTVYPATNLDFDSPAAAESDCLSKQKLWTNSDISHVSNCRRQDGEPPLSIDTGVAHFVCDVSTKGSDGNYGDPVTKSAGRVAINRVLPGSSLSCPPPDGPTLIYKVHTPKGDMCIHDPSEIADADSCPSYQSDSQAAFWRPIVVGESGALSESACLNMNDGSSCQVKKVTDPNTGNSFWTNYQVENGAQCYEPGNTLPTLPQDNQQDPPTPDQNGQCSPYGSGMDSGFVKCNYDPVQVCSANGGEQVCPTGCGTVNGEFACYLPDDNGDGKPDQEPTPPTRDTDGDGIPDSQDPTPNCRTGEDCNGDGQPDTGGIPSGGFNFPSAGDIGDAVASRLKGEPVPDAQQYIDQIQSAGDDAEKAITDEMKKTPEESGLKTDIFGIASVPIPTVFAVQTTCQPIEIYHGYTVDFCEHASDVRALLYWVFNVLTALRLWELINRFLDRKKG